MQEKKSRWLFEMIHIIRFEMHMDRQDKSENIFWIQYFPLFLIPWIQNAYEGSAEFEPTKLYSS